MYARRKIYDWLKTQAAAVLLTDPAYGTLADKLAVCLVREEMDAAVNRAKPCGIVFSDCDESIGLKGDTTLSATTETYAGEGSGVRLIIYSRVAANDRGDHSEALDRIELVRAWLFRQLANDGTAGGNVCDARVKPLWRTPSAADSWDSQKYHGTVGVLDYQEDN